MSFVAAIAACQPEPPAVAFVTDRFDIAPEFDGPLCAGNIPYMEARLSWLEEVLEVEPVGRVRYNWVSDAGEFCDGPLACAIGHTLYGPWSEFEHELVHVIATTSMGRASPFLEEGLAVALTSLSAAPGVPSEWLGRFPHDLETTARGDFYGGAGHFVRFLLDTRGMAPWKRLYAASDYDDSAATLRARFAEAYGESFAEIEAEYLDAAWDAYPPLSGCPAPDLLPWMPSGEFALECDDPAVMRTGPNVMVRPITLGLVTRTVGDFLVAGKRASPDWCPLRPVSIDGLFVGSLEAGLHTATVGAPLDEPKVVRAEFWLR
ncbi:hypothetical protein [Nannocystis exedens]|uniref:hypothetical protein n=1 Tax=Nannocystis exedens TaxID=54 RepID=UPI000BB9FD67|nr:hypothetical protein [Nannocystis exedens]